MEHPIQEQYLHMMEKAQFLGLQVADRRHLHAQGAIVQQAFDPQEVDRFLLQMPPTLRLSSEGRPPRCLQSSPLHAAKKSTPQLHPSPNQTRVPFVSWYLVLPSIPAGTRPVSGRSTRPVSARSRPLSSVRSRPHLAAYNSSISITDSELDEEPISSKTSCSPINVTEQCTNVSSPIESEHASELSPSDRQCEQQTATNTDSGKPDPVVRLLAYSGRTMPELCSRNPSKRESLESIQETNEFGLLAESQSFSTSGSESLSRPLEASARFSLAPSSPTLPLSSSPQSLSAPSHSPSQPFPYPPSSQHSSAQGSVARATLQRASTAPATSRWVSLESTEERRQPRHARSAYPAHTTRTIPVGQPRARSAVQPSSAGRSLSQQRRFHQQEMFLDGDASMRVLLSSPIHQAQQTHPAHSSNFLKQLRSRGQRQTWQLSRSFDGRLSNRGLQLFGHSVVSP
eukprot:m.211932 g.211932  ORF g.211932 m.211932 type:complete len:456 (+) comp16943_c0_seq2:2064-3431(+)